MRRAAGCLIASLFILTWASPAFAARPSPRPTAILVGTGTITVGDTVETYIEVEASDVDGIITEIDVFWGDGSISFAHAYPCLIPPVPAPGDPHRFIVSNPYAEPGGYTVRYVVHSSADCTGTGSGQHSRPYVTRVTAP